MKRFIKTNHLLIKLKPLMATLILLFTLIVDVNAQSMKNNLINMPTLSYGVGSVDPTEITGNTVTLSGIECAATVSYQWQSASDVRFTNPVNIAGATSQNYNPTVVYTTTFFRRIASFNCASTDYKNLSNTVMISVKSVPAATSTSTQSVTPN